MKKPEYIAVLITAGSEKEAKKIKKALLAQRLAACVNEIGGVKSSFWWKGKIDNSPEVLLVAKTKDKYFKEIVGLVKTIHSYQVPEIIGLPIIAGNQDYLNWLSETLQKKT